VREPTRHRSAEGLLLREQTGFSFSDQDVRRIDKLLAPLHQHLRRLSDLPRPPLDFSRQYRAAKQMCAHALGKIGSTSRTEIRASTKGIGG
jgi:hypothetical protein